MMSGRALVVGSRPLAEGGGVSAVCRQVVEALRGSGYTTRYEAASTAVDRRSVPIPRRLRTVAESFVPSAKGASEPHVAVTNGPLGLRIRAASEVHIYHGTYVGQAAAVRDAISSRGYLRMRYLDGLTLERLAGRGKRCLANSGTTAKEVRKYFGHQCEVVWCPVDTEAFHPDQGTSPAAGGLVPDGPYGLFVGAGRPMKGEMIAYEVMRRFPRLTWSAVGTEPLPPATPPRGARRLGHVDPTTMPSLLREATVLLAPSVYEPFGILVAEALCSGTPVVMGPCGVSELLPRDAREAFVAQPATADALAERLEEILCSPDDAARMAMDAREAIRRRCEPAVWRRNFLAAAGLSTAAPGV